MALFLVRLAETANPDFRVQDGSLPGLPNPLTSKIYSGFYNVSRTRHLHFAFVESMKDPDNDPLMVWFSGGPGVTSIGFIVIRHGPYLL